MKTTLSVLIVFRLQTSRYYKARPRQSCPPDKTQPIPRYNEDAVMRQTADFHKAELLLPNGKLHTYSAVKSNQLEYFVKSTSNWPKSYPITK